MMRAMMRAAISLMLIDADYAADAVRHDADAASAAAAAFAMP